MWVALRATRVNETKAPASNRQRLFLCTTVDDGGWLPALLSMRG
jgi:hypothetical protein